MRIQIDNKILSDSPYNEENKNLFISYHVDTNNLIQDIKHGTATCYFISGYRGAGKSSFINRIKSEFKSPYGKEKVGLIDTFFNWLIRKFRRDKKDKDFEEVVFVNVNFSRYENHTNLLRKLIRGLYIRLRELDSFKIIKKQERKKRLEEQSILGLEELFEKTFYETSRDYSKSIKTELVISQSVGMKLVMKLVPTILLFAVCILNVIVKSAEVDLINKVVIGVSCLITITIVIKVTYSNMERKDFNRKTMYDDEIADYHFDRILRDLKNEGYRIVFVLDELDKVEDAEMNKLLKEIKPYLVSGEASFIAVAGQKLYYKYEQAKYRDDELLSSVFSRFIHIYLLSRQDFRLLFDKVLIDKDKLTDEEKTQLNQYIDYLILESKNVPRKFISIIRH